MLRAIQVCIALLTVVTRRLQFCCCRMVLILASGTKEVNTLLSHFPQFLSCYNVYVGEICLKQKYLHCTPILAYFIKGSVHPTLISDVGASHI
jgi:hypothetical protein